MRGINKRLPLLAAIIMALVLAAIPGTVEAQSTPAPFDAQSCLQTMQNGVTDQGQAKAIARTKVANAATKPDMKLVYCWSTLQTMFNTIGTLTSGASIFGSIIWQLVQTAIQGFLNQLCQAVVGAIQSAINMFKNLLCIPLPHFSLGAGFNLGSFGGGTCNGVSLLSLGSSAAVRQAPPTGYSPLWNYTPQ